MKNEIRNLSLLIALAFFVIASTSFYWSIVQRNEIEQRPDNPRRILEEQRFVRGTIYDRDGRILAQSVSIDADGLQERLYTSPAISSGVGYYNYRFGAAGLEADFNEILSSDSTSSGPIAQAINSLLQKPGEGYELRTTLSLPLQELLFAQMQGKQGAAVLIDATNGDVLASISVPTFNPDELDAALEQFALAAPTDTLEEQRSQLFNRVQNGLYQPGTLMLLPLTAMLLESDISLETTIETVSTTSVTEFTFFDQNCDLLLLNNTAELTIADAFRNGCTAPFIHLLGTTLSFTQFDAFMWQFGLYSPPSLFRGETSTGITTPNFDDNTQRFSRSAIGSGQGIITFSPLQVAHLITAIVNDGNAPNFVLANAFRITDSSTWRPLTDASSESYTALFSQSTAAELRNLIRQTDTIYGYAASAFVGDPLKRLSWFSGFVELGDENGSIALVVVLENATSSDEAAHLGSMVLETIQAEALFVPQRISD